MTPCPKCFLQNAPGAVACRDCKTPLRAATPTCAHGHLMSETWTECAYCRAEGRLGVSEVYRPTTVELFPHSQPAGHANRTTTLESPAPPQMNPSYFPPAASPAIPTVDVRASRAWPPPQPAAASDPSASRLPRRTVYVPEAPLNSAEAASKQAQEKIVAVLISYTWDPAGQVFPIREGRNRIGADSSQCEVALGPRNPKTLEPLDDTLSSIHSIINVWKKITISDYFSKNGTYVDGERVEEQYHPLKNYSEIRTGSTTWIFVILDRERTTLAAVTPTSSAE